ncbi:MOD1 [Scenedesmus sp. PABB004]|nr:MOD1 [Scenedesmus sp. PABB004]
MPGRCSFVVTGFGAFAGVAHNPTQALAEWLAAREHAESGYDVAGVHVLEVSAGAVTDWLAEQAAALEAACARGGGPVVLLHLGVDAARHGFNLEECAVNTCTFRCPDQRGYQPTGEPIERGAGPLTSARRTGLPLPRLAAELRAAGFDCHVSQDAGRFVCNYVYHKSLRLAEALSSKQQSGAQPSAGGGGGGGSSSSSSDSWVAPDGGAAAAQQQQQQPGGGAPCECAAACHSLFVHVPSFTSIPEDRQKAFLVHLLAAIAAAPGSTARAAAAPDGAEPARRALLSGLLGGALALSPPAPSSAAAPPAPATPAAPGCAAAPGGSRGAAAARDPAINSGCATPPGVRRERELRGLLPPRTVAPQVEVLRARAALDGCCSALEKHRLLVALRETNEAAYVALLRSDVEGLLPLVYTPTIGDACLAWGSLVPRATGLYITPADRGRVLDVLRRWPSDEVRIAVVTDGERILGLGDLGAHGMGIPTGKAAVYAAAGVDPAWLLPVTVDVGTNNAVLRADPLYVGNPEPRQPWASTRELMEELVTALHVRFRRRVLVHWEDLAGANASDLLERVGGGGLAPTFNDDIQATAAVALAAARGAARVPGVPPLAAQRWLLFGAGSANLGIAQTLVAALGQEGVPPAAARARIWLVDSRGLVLRGREGGLTPAKAEFAQDADALPGGAAAAAALGGGAGGGAGRRALAAIVAAVRPTALVGAAAVAGAFDRPVVEALCAAAAAEGGPGARPLVMALSNPTSRAEVTFADALRWSCGRAVYASGSPMDAATSAGRALVPGQANNAHVFAGLGLGAVRCGAERVTDAMLLAAAAAVAGAVTPEELAAETVLPRIGRLPEVTAAVAAAVEHAAGAPAAA